MAKGIYNNCYYNVVVTNDNVVVLDFWGGQMVTLKDIAEKCNVSLSTVSKALNGSSEIGARTIERVNAVAEEMGYHPNSAARALKTNRSYNIGVIFEDKTESGLQHQYFAAIFDSLKVEAESLGYDITFISSKLGGKDNYLRHTKYRGCDGIAIVVADYSRDDIKMLLESNVPVTTLDNVVAGSTAVMSDNTNGMKILAGHIISKGHKRIAYIHGEKTDVTMRRLDSFYSTCAAHNIEIPENYIIEAVYHDPALTEDATRKLLALDEPPTCILYPDDFAILGGIKVVQEKQLEIGKDISIAGYDGILLSSLLHPSITTYKQDGERLGKQLAFQLIKEIEHPGGFAPEEIYVPGYFVPGESVSDLTQN
ncbi:MAG: LacI family DNA-binding transcriptional regulator [Spirochaetales bacterium]|nr:LacI family DNA-binding transcriptional regulator [Spirochaetales bacterium]